MELRNGRRKRSPAPARRRRGPRSGSPGVAQVPESDNLSDSICESCKSDDSHDDSTRRADRSSSPDPDRSSVRSSLWELDRSSFSGSVRSLDSESVCSESTLRGSSVGSLIRSGIMGAFWSDQPDDEERDDERVARAARELEEARAERLDHLSARARGHGVADLRRRQRRQERARTVVRSIMGFFCDVFDCGWGQRALVLTMFLVIGGGGFFSGEYAMFLFLYHKLNRRWYHSHDGVFNVDVGFSGRSVGKNEVMTSSRGASELVTKASLSLEAGWKASESWREGVADSPQKELKTVEAGENLDLEDYSCLAVGRRLGCYSADKKICILFRLGRQFRPDTVLAMKVAEELFAQCKGFVNYLEA